MNRPTLPLLPGTLALAAALALAGCSSVNNMLQGEKVDYRSAAGKTNPLEVPPDLTQLQRDNRYAPQGGTVSAATYQAPNAAAAGATATAADGPGSVAPQQLGDVRVVRNGEVRYLVSGLTPEQLWPLLQAFWQERGFNLVVDNPQAGVLETDWAENRAKLPQDIIRNTIGRVLDSLYSTGELDKFRTRVERSERGSEIYVTHRRMEEVLVGATRDQTRWTPRPADRDLEAEMLARMMVKLGTKEDAARSAVATAGTPAAAGSRASTEPARARVLNDQGTASLQVDEPFDRAWRRVGLALDRGGFTVEDRDRRTGVYYVRYAETRAPGPQADKGFLSRVFGWFGRGSDKDDATLARYRIVLKGADNATTVSVLDNQGTPDNGSIAQRIVSLLVDELK